MKHFLCVFSVGTVLAILACSSDSESNNGSSGSSGSSGTSGTSGTSGASGTSGTSGTSGASGTSGTSGTSGSSGDTPPAASTKEVDVLLSTCPTFTACPSNPSGTYDYTGGCAGDVFAQAKQACPTLDTTGAKVTVSGSIYFLANAALKRDVTVKISGSVKIPQSCSQGQCAIAQQGLAQYFPGATCTGNTDCTCTVSKTDTAKNTTTFTVAGSTVTTGDGETYSVCEQGTSFKYNGKSAGSEKGNWELTKR